MGRRKSRLTTVAKISRLPGKCRDRSLRAALAAILAGAWLGAGLAAYAAEPARVLTDSAGRKVEVPKSIDRVLPAGFPAAVLLYTLAPDKLVAWPGPLGAGAMGMLPEKYAKLPVVGRLTSARSAPSAEAIQALHPDVILDVGTVDQHFAALADRVQKETGIPYLLYDGSLARTAATYRALGAALGEEVPAEELASYAERAIAGAGKTLAAHGERVRVYYARGEGGTTTAFAGSVTAEVIDAVGAENVARRGASGAFVPVTIEQVIAWRPDAFVASDPDLYAIIMREPRWQQVEAIRTGHVYLAPGAPFGWLDEPPGVNRLIGLGWLAGVLAQGKPPADMKAVARNFYARFYHVELTAAQLDELLAPPRLP